MHTQSYTHIYPPSASSPTAPSLSLREFNSQGMGNTHSVCGYTVRQTPQTLCVWIHSHTSTHVWQTHTLCVCHALRVELDPGGGKRTVREEAEGG